MVAKAKRNLRMPLQIPVEHVRPGNMNHGSFLLALLIVSASCNGFDRRDISREPQSQPSISSLEDRSIIYLGFSGSDEPWLEAETYRALGDYLTAHTPYRFQVTMGRNPDELLGFLEERYVDVALLGVVSYLDARKQFGAVPLVKPLGKNGQAVARSVFITRESGPIAALSDLRGRSLALSSAHSSMGNLMPRYELMDAGLPIEELQELESLNHGGDVVESVLEGRFDAGAVEDQVAHSNLSRGLKPFHTSRPLPTGPFTVRPDLPHSVAQLIAEALLLLRIEDADKRADWNPAVRYGFVRTSDEDYAPLRQIINRRPNGCGGTCHPDVRF